MGGAVTLPCWCFGLRYPSTRTYRLLGAARSSYQNGSFQGRSHQWVLPATSVLVLTVSHNCPLVSLKDPSRPGGKPDPGSYKVTAISLSAHETLCTAPKSFYFSQSCGVPATQPHCPIGDSQAGKPDKGFRILTPMGESLWYNYFLVCGLATQWVSDLIISRMHPSYHFIMASSLSL